MGNLWKTIAKKRRKELQKDTSFLKDTKFGKVDTRKVKFPWRYYTPGSTFILLPEYRGHILEEEERLKLTNMGRLAKVIRWVDPYIQIGGGDEMRYKHMVIEVNGERKIIAPAHYRLSWKLYEA